MRDPGGVLTVGAAGEVLALPAGAVREVLRPAPLTRVPQAPASLLGLLNRRGAVLPVLSLARLMGRAAAPPSPAARVVVVESGATVGLLVDSVLRLGDGEGARAIDLPALLARDFGGLARAAPRRASPPAEAGGDGRPDGRGDEALSLLVFTLAGQDYALPLDKVAAVARLPQAITALPHAERAMLGLAPFQGGPLPLVSLHVLLGLPASGTAAERARVVVTRLGAARIGLVVDGVRAIRRVPPSALDPVPPVLSRGLGEARVEAIARLDGESRLVPVLLPTGLFDEATTARLTEGAGGRAMPASGPEGERIERFVIFRLGGEHYGLPVASVEEVVRRPAALTRIPHAPAFVQGAMNRRGAVLPVIDQRRRFAGPEGDGAEGAGGRIVVVTIDGLRAGLAVDAVSGVMPVAAADLLPAPALAEGEARVLDRLARVERGGRMILLIDPRTLLGTMERDLLAALAARDTAAP